MLYLKANRPLVQNTSNSNAWSLANLLCVRWEKNSFARWPKRKLLDAQDQGTAERKGLRRWPERLLNIMAK